MIALQRLARGFRAFRSESLGVGLPHIFGSFKTCCRAQGIHTVFTLVRMGALYFLLV